MGEGEFAPLTTPTPLNRQSPNIAHVITSTVSPHMPHMVKVAPEGPQTYLQRPSSWGRATAGRQDVVSHVYTAMRKVYSLHSSSRQM